MRGSLRGVLGREEGFTLAEVLVTMMVMLLVLSALYAIFDMSIKVYSFGNDEVEAVENARLGLEKMEREIRAAHPFDATDDSTANDHLFFDTTDPGFGKLPPASRITFGNDLGLTGDGRLGCPDAETCEFITYKLASSADPDRACGATTAPCTLRRVKGGNSANRGEPVVEYVGAGGLTFAYYEGDGTAPEGEPEITQVRVRLQIQVGGGDQTLTTNVTLRNRAEG